MTDTLAHTGTIDNIRAGITFDEIVSLARQRRSQDSLLLRYAIDTRDRYNGDVVLPLTDVDGAPDMDPPTVRLIAQAIDGTSMRAASPNPTIVCPAMTPGAARSEKAADIRRKMLYAHWEDSQLRIKLYRSYRHLTAYGTCAWVVLPDDECKIARVELRDPLTTYPELRNQDDIREPRNVIFIYGRSIDWICAHYPKARNFFYNAANKNWDTLWDIVEYVDCDEIVIGILGPRMPAYSPQDARPYGYNGFELVRFRNKAGMVPIVVPRRVTLDRIMGQMSTMIPSTDLHARLTALELAAAEKHVFPDLVMLSEPNQIADVVNTGGWKDGRSGEVNVVRNARGVQYLTNATPPFVPEMVQNLEEAIRESGGASGMFGGNNPGSLRTGRALDVMGSFQIDPRVEEAQRIQAKALTVVDEALVAVTKGYFGRKKYWMFTGLQGDESMVEFQGSDLDCGTNVVEYPIPGADISQLSVAILQLKGANLVSAKTAMVKHPWIDDPEQEIRQMAEDQIREALLGGTAQQIATGAMPITDAANVLGYIEKGMSLVDALQKAQKEAQARQAAQAPPPQPGQNTAPGQQPGLSMPGTGVEQGPPGQQPGIPTPPMGLANLHSLIRNINSQPQVSPTGGPPGA